jgi:hypothetical protein
MAAWHVVYEAPDKKPQETYVTLADDKYKTGMQVKDAIEKGEIADLFIRPGAIVLVERHKAASASWA